MKADDTPWWAWIVTVNVVLVLATIAWGYLGNGSTELTAPLVPLGELTLSNEMNVSVWWAGICLLVTGLICYELYSTGRGLYWLPVAPVFVGLSFDEIGSIHERASWYLTRPQVLLLLLAGGLCLVPAIWKLLSVRSTRTSAVLLLTGFLLMASAAVHEYIEVQIGVPQWLVGLRLGVEEGSELFGTLLCLLAVVRERGPATGKTGWLPVIPNPFRMLWIRWLLTAAALGQVVIAVMTVMFVDVSSRGNPAIYTPSAMFFILFSACLWCASSRRDRGGGIWYVLSIASLLSSVATFHLLAPGAIRWLGNTAQLYALWALYLVTAGLLTVATKDRRGLSVLAAPVVVAVTFVAAAVIGDQLPYYVASGIVALAIALPLLTYGLDPAVTATGERQA